jgi:hypothetical protein
MKEAIKNLLLDYDTMNPKHHARGKLVEHLDKQVTKDILHIIQERVLEVMDDRQVWRDKYALTEQQSEKHAYANLIGEENTRLEELSTIKDRIRNMN